MNPLFGQTLVLYLMAGVGVAFAIYVSKVDATHGTRWFRVAAAIPFWPLFLPMLLSSSDHRVPDNAASKAPRDEMMSAIQQVDTELDAAFGCLDGWAEDVLAREKGRIQELRVAWIAQVERIREMDRLLVIPAESDAEPMPATSTRLRQSLQARQQNMERLKRVRQRANDDLMGNLAWVRELVSMIHLAKFTGAPAARAEELVAQIAAAVEGLSEVTGQEDAVVRAGIEPAT